MKPTLTVFMFHRVLPFPHREALTADAFEKTLDFLEKSFTFLSPEESYAFLEGTLPHVKAPHYAMLTFDDGWADNLFFADPVLKKKGLSATLAVSTAFTKPGTVRTGLPREILSRGMDEAREIAMKQGDCSPFLNEAELAEMTKSGRWIPEVHGTIHEKGTAGTSRFALPEPGESKEEFLSFLKSDFSSCKTTLERITGRAPRAMFWPWGHYSETSLEVASELGLRFQFTVKKGICFPGDTRKILPRVGVSSNEKKLRKNAFVFRNPLLANLHDLFHTEKVFFP